MSPEEYRRHVAECLRLADGLRGPQQRLLLVDMAQAWLQLAYQAEKTLVDEAFNH